MPSISRVLPNERVRFVVLALLLFMNSLILESNEVVATSGFITHVGPEQILWLWAIDMLIVILASGTYSLFIDRTKRQELASYLFVGFSLAYVVLYLLFFFHAPDVLSYPLLTVVNDQQWLLFPLMIWALANDLFSVSEAKRLFPLLGIAAFAGGISGNALTAGVANALAGTSLGGVQLLLFNASLLMAMAIILPQVLRRTEFTVHQSRQNERVLDTLREGLAFVREVPSYRYLTLAMILLGVGLNVVEYQLAVTAAHSYSQVAALATFLATLRAVRIVLMLLVQGMVAGWLLKRLEFRSIFAVMPIALLSGLLLALICPFLLGVAIADSMARITLQGVDEPSRRAFLGLVPDERRGRVSVFLEGYLYPAGSILSCGLIGIILFSVSQHLLSAQIGRALYFLVACACAGTALWAITRFRAHYDASMLNWRLRRRQRRSALADLDL